MCLFLLVDKKNYFFSIQINQDAKLLNIFSKRVDTYLFEEFNYTFIEIIRFGWLISFKKNVALKIFILLKKKFFIIFLLYFFTFLF